MRLFRIHPKSIKKRGLRRTRQKRRKTRKMKKQRKSKKIQNSRRYRKRKSKSKRRKGGQYGNNVATSHRLGFDVSSDPKQGALATPTQHKSIVESTDSMINRTVDMNGVDGMLGSFASSQTTL